jgi:hypothetical protein
VICVILNIAASIVILALDTADCLPIRVSAKLFSLFILLHGHRVRDTFRAQLRSMPEYRQTTETRYAFMSLLLVAFGYRVGPSHAHLFYD